MIEVIALLMLISVDQKPIEMCHAKVQTKTCLKGYHCHVQERLWKETKTEKGFYWSETRVYKPVGQSAK